MTLADTLDQAKWTFATRRVDRACVAPPIPISLPPNPAT